MPCRGVSIFEIHYDASTDLEEERSIPFERCAQREEAFQNCALREEARVHVN